MTPEAKLLELIKKNPSTKWAPHILARWSRRQVENALRRGSKLRRALLSGFSRVTGLQWINRLLVSASAICMLHLIAGIVGSSRTGDGVSSSGLRGVAEARANRSNVHAIQLADLTRRNVFHPLIAAAPPPPKIVRTVTQPPPPPPKPPLSQRLSYLKLVGIMNTAPLQAIVEDQKNQKTLYLTAGQPVEDAQVENVLNDKVIFVSGNDRYSLTM